MTVQTAVRLLFALALAAATSVRAEDPAKVTADQSPPAQWPAMANAGDPLAQALLARAYLLGTDGMLRNRETAALWADRSAGQKHPLGLFLRGYASFLDRTRPEAERKAAAKPFFEQAIAAGFAKQAERGGRQWLALLGDAHENGYGMPKNIGEALKCWRKAADLGDPNAMTSLGHAYDEPTGVPRDEKKAVRWFRKAAGLGDSNAMALIGLCYANGIGVAKDAAVAVDWYRKAADRGSGIAMFHLGWCYLDGEGAPKDGSEGVKWLRKAADASETPAMVALGHCYENGLGVSADKAAAVKWYRKAAVLGNPIAKKALEKLGAAE